MKIAAIAFFALLIYAHVLGGVETMLPRPLSMFREGEFAVLGYAMFCTLALVGGVYTFDLWRLGRPAEAANAGFAIVVLLIVAATPSSGTLHADCAFILLGSMFAYYSILLYRSSRPWMFVHLSIPILLAVAIGFRGYGVWQKALISYFVIAAVVHHHVVRRAARAPAPPEPDVFHKQPKVYRVDPGRPWPRRRDK